jgi:outer membrane protein TolC
MKPTVHSAGALKGLRGLAALAALLWPLSGAAAADLGLGRALIMAERSSPLLKAALARESGAGEAVWEARSGTLPTLDLSAVDSAGFPGSATGLDGFAGLVASPYRKGPAADAFSKWNLVDASAWYAVAAAKYEAGASHEFARVQRAQVDQQALRVYLEAVRSRGDRDAWGRLVQALQGVRDTVRRFVRNGQYSEVQRMLIEDQLDDADLKQEDFDRGYRALVQRLAILTGLDAAGLSCPGPEQLDEDSLSVIQAPQGDSPLVLQAVDEAKAASETSGKFGAENLPRIELGASAGAMDSARLLGAQDYSVFGGVTFPVFEGMKTWGAWRQAALESEARGQEVIQARLALDDLNVRLDEQIDEARNDLNRLLPEQARAAQAVSLAKSRYLNFLGPLSDLQQALKDSVNVDSQISEVKTLLLLSLGTRSLVNGGTLEGAP